MSKELTAAGYRVCRFLFLCLVTLGGPGCYVLKQAYHHNNLYNSRQPIDELIEKPETSKKLRERLVEVKSILEYAAVANLRTESAYRHFIFTDRPVSYLVQASPADQLKLKRWWFPITGAVPYLGYHEEKERDEMAAKLKGEGLDVAFGTVGAFSSLGWFPDPIYEPMLKRHRRHIAHLLFHELVHRTIWVTGQAKFNENLAEYVAIELTEAYLRSKDAESEIQMYLDERRDKRLYANWLSGLKQKLKVVFTNASKLSRERVLEQKKLTFQAAKKSLPEFRTKRYEFARRKEWNNASILGASLYVPDRELFARARKCSQTKTLGEFLLVVEKRVQDFDDPLQTMKDFCDQ